MTIEFPPRHRNPPVPVEFLGTMQTDEVMPFDARHVSEADAAPQGSWLATAAAVLIIAMVILVWAAIIWEVVR